MIKLICAMSAAFVCVGMSGTAFSQITGNVTLQGKPPVMPQIQAIANDPVCAKMHKNPVFEESVVVGANGQLQNVVVSIEPAARQTLNGPIPKNPAVLDQKGCVYRPHVIAFMIGQSFNVKNSDKCIHNVHGTCIDNDAFNVAETPAAVKQIDNVKVAETFKIKCDIHPWMFAWVRAFDHPYFAVTDANGDYSIDTAGLANGKYTLIFWQERFGEMKQDVTVNNGKGAADCQFK